MVELLFDQIRIHADIYWIGQNWHSSNNEIKSINEELQMIKENLQESIEINDLSKLVEFESKLLNFKNYFDSSS